MWEVLLGGVLVIAGGWLSGWQQSRSRLKNRMAEATAERKVVVNAEAFSHIKLIEASYIQARLEDTLREIDEREQWFFSNRLFLPGDFPKHWLAIRLNLRKVVRGQKSPSADPAKLEALDAEIKTAIDRAVDEIYKDAGIPRSELGHTTF